MAAEMSPLTVFPGQDLVHQGEAADRIFVLADGARGPPAALPPRAHRLPRCDSPQDQQRHVGSMHDGLVQKCLSLRRLAYDAASCLQAWHHATGQAACWTCTQAEPGGGCRVLPAHAPVGWQA